MKPKHLSSTSFFVPSDVPSGSRWLSRGLLKQRVGQVARALPLWAFVVGVSHYASPAPARAQATSESHPVEAWALPLDKALEIPFPAAPGSFFQQKDALVRVRSDGAGAARVLRIEPVTGRTGRAHVQVTQGGRAAQVYAIQVGASSNVLARDATFGTLFTALAPAPRLVDHPIGVDAASPSGVTRMEPLPPIRTSGGLPSGVNEPLALGEANVSSQDFPLPPRLPRGRGAFPVAPTWTRQRAQAVAPRSRETGRVIRVKQGLARFLSFRQNILTVYFSNTDVMDARALTARAVAVTGTAPGSSTLAVNIAQSPTDTVGRFEIFTIVVEPATPNLAPARDAAATESAIRSALFDPRVNVRVVQNPNGALAALLSGTVRDAAELNAARSTAALFVPNEAVISSIYLDPLAPTIGQALNPTVPLSGEVVLTAKLRQALANDSIEVVSLPGSLVIKAVVDSAEDAEVLLGLLPSLNTRVTPLITIRGRDSGGASVDASGQSVAPTLDPATGEAQGKYYGANRPVLNGEDAEITRRLQEVTGVRTVYAVRTAQNAVALYGSVLNRSQYETVRRYIVMLPVLGSGASQVAQTRTVSTGGALPLPGQSVNGAGAAGGTPNPNLTPANAGGVNPAAQFNPQLRMGTKSGARSASFENPYLLANAQISSGAGGGTTGAVAPATTGAFGTGPATGALAPTGPNSSGVGTGTGASAFGTGGAFGAANNFNGFGNNTGLVPGGFGGASNLTFESAQSTGSGSTAQAPGFTNPQQALLDPTNAAQQPHAGYRSDVNVQMFVRILDPDAQSVRRVTLESNIVEISRTSLKNLGIESGSVSVLTEDINRGAAPTAPTFATNPTTGQTTILSPGSPGTPDIITRTIDPAFRAGIAVAANGFAGGSGLGFIDPFRLRLNALYQSGNARILSRPNMTAVEGADAQIVIGGERPVPSAVATGQAVGQSIVFRRFGIIMTMRPTVSDDDTIILQIRADVTELAPEFGINLSGALIPGERVRSINTTVTVRSGDTFVIGGLITNDRRQQTSRIPILSSIPIIGALFKSKRFENNESELAIFMTPRLDRTNVSLNTREAVNRVPSLPPLPSGTLDQFVVGGSR